MMKWISTLLWSLCVVACAPATVEAASREPALVDPVWVCPALDTHTHPPQPDAAGCVRQSLWTVDPQGRHLWVLRELHLDSAQLASTFGLQLSAKASSHVYLNGVLLGENGQPADTAADEQPGLMDVVMRIAPGLLQVGNNQIAARMSSHRGWLHLSQPIHGMAPAPYSSIQDQLLRHYLPTLVPLGVFMLAGFYFLSMTLRSERKILAALLSLLSLLAALQLLFEISRGLYAYAYPRHDVRLIGILLCSVSFGLCLVAIMLWQFAPIAWRGRLWLAAAITIGVSTVTTSGMDGKASLALFIASAWGAVVAAYAWWHGRLHAGAHTWALAVFGAANLLAPELFLDRYFYLLVAGLLMFLMAQQALAHAREQRQQREQRARADRLQAALEERALAHTDVVLSVPSMGKLRRVPASSIAHIQGAGDYAELHLSSGESVLHTTSLNALEAQLPSCFLRVHRSHLVNTRLIERLQQGEGGTGLLFLQNGTSVPVSRRIMPGVRKALR